MIDQPIYYAEQAVSFKPIAIGETTEQIDDLPFGRWDRPYQFGGAQEAETKRRKVMPIVIDTPYIVNSDGSIQILRSRNCSRERLCSQMS